MFNVKKKTPGSSTKELEHFYKLFTIHATQYHIKDELDLDLVPPLVVAVHDMRHDELGLGVPLVRCLRLARLRRTIRHLCNCFILFIAAMALYQRCQRLLASIPFIQLVSRLYSTSTYPLLSVSQGCC